MNKLALTLLSIIMMLSFITSTNVLAEKQDKVDVIIDSKSMTLNKANIQINGEDIETEVPSVVYRGSTFVPLRFICEKLGVSLEWDKVSRYTIIKTQDKEIKIKEGSDIAIVNGESQKLPNNTKIKLMYSSENKDPRIIVPLRFMSEILDYDLNWIKGTTTSNLITDSFIVKDANTNNKDTIEIENENKTDTETEEESKKEEKQEIKINKITSIGEEIIDGKKAIVISNHISSQSKTFKLSNPNRLVVDILNTTIGDEINKYSSDIVKNVRISKFEDKIYKNIDVTRVVFDLTDKYNKFNFSKRDNESEIIIFIEEDLTPDNDVKSQVPKAPKPQPKPVIKKTIVIDAGHGGKDAGAVKNGLQEKDLALSVSLETRRMLNDLGYNVIMTRTGDTYPSISSRYQLANKHKADAFVSVHFNSATSPKATGIETLYSTKNASNKGFAQSIQNQLIKTIGAVNRGLKYRKDLGVLNGTKGISTLVELGFISNAQDAKEINTPSYIQKCATAITNGIHSFFS